MVLTTEQMGLLKDSIKEEFSLPENAEARGLIRTPNGIRFEWVSSDLSQSWTTNLEGSDIQPGFVPSAAYPSQTYTTG